MRRSAAAQSVISALRSVPVDTDYIKFAGGLDLVTAPLARKPGVARVAQNFEAEILGGYRRVAGYERFDGRVKPSDASYSIISATITTVPALGDTLTGATSAATGIIIALPGGSFVITKVTGTFVNGENLNVGGPTIAVATSAAIPESASTRKLHAQYKNLAADKYRADITVVTGESRILGGFWLNDVCYAFRNNVGSTAAALFKSTAGGWSAVALGRKLLWTTAGAGAQINDNDTVTGATSGATGVVKRAMLESGTWVTGSGKLVFASITGAFVNGENIQVGGVTKVVSNGADSAITLLPNGRYECLKENFGGATITKRVYGVDGVNPGFEFDGTTFCPIKTGMASDTPSHVIAHKKHLVFAFGSSLQHSGIGTPYMWTVLSGATELAMGDTITGFAEQSGSADGGALAVFTRNRLSILYGSSASDWNLVAFRDELGAYEHTIQDIGFSVFLDDRGVTDIRTSQAFGNFSHNALSEQVRTLINTSRTLAVASSISRDRNQYRLYFSDGTALYFTVAGSKVVGIMPIRFTNVVRCVWTSEKNDGSEVMFFGSDSGYVFQMDKGTSHDGADIEYFLELAYNFCGSPRVQKVFRDVMLEVSGTGYAEFYAGFSLGYGSADIVQPLEQIATADFSDLQWDSFTWDQFYWDGETLAPSVLKMGGEAVNYSLTFRGTSDYFEPFTLTGAITQYTPRRRMR